MTVIIGKVKDEHGWAGNMAPFQVKFDGSTYRTSEALFQSLRFKDLEIIQKIRDQKSPMAAKMVAKKHRSAMVVEPMSQQDIVNMRLCLYLKTSQNQSVLDALVLTKDRFIVEDCTKRKRGSGLFWGAAFENDAWVGENWLGKLWMELRSPGTVELLYTKKPVAAFTKRTGINSV